MLRTLIVSALLLASLVQAAPSCGIVQGGATYDLSELALPNSHYEVDDSIDSDQRNYIYEFNICGAAHNVPSMCHNSSTVGAFQYFNDTSNQCASLGTVASASWALLDGTNPAAGAFLVYDGGDACTMQDGTTKPRSIGINFRCSKTVTKIPSSRVSESNCEYEVTFESALACPKECPIVEGQLCSNHGFCGFDQDSQQTRCFCNTGRAGDACQSFAPASSSMFSPTSVLIAIVIILLIALLAMAALLFSKIRKLRADDNPYGALQEGSSTAVSLNA